MEIDEITLHAIEEKTSKDCIYNAILYLIGDLEKCYRFGNTSEFMTERDYIETLQKLLELFKEL